MLLQLVFTGTRMTNPYRSCRGAQPKLGLLYRRPCVICDDSVWIVFTLKFGECVLLPE